MFSGGFCKICKNFFIAEHHWTTASYYSSINSSEGELATETMNYDTKAKAYVMKQSQRGAPWNSVLRNFTKFTGKYLDLPATLLKKRLWHRCLPVNFVKFLRTLFFTEHLWWLLLYVTIWARSVFEQVSEAVVHRFSSKQVFSKTSEKHLCWRHFLIKLQSWRLY